MTSSLLVVGCLNQRGAHTADRMPVAMMLSWVLKDSFSSTWGSRSVTRSLSTARVIDRLTLLISSP